MSLAHEPASHRFSTSPCDPWQSAKRHAPRSLRLRVEHRLGRGARRLCRRRRPLALGQPRRGGCLPPRHRARRGPGRGPRRAGTHAAGPAQARRGEGRSRARPRAGREAAAPREEPRAGAGNDGRRRQRGGPCRRQGAPRPIPARCDGARSLHRRVRPDRLLRPPRSRGRAAGAARAAGRRLWRGLVVHQRARLRPGRGRRRRPRACHHRALARRQPAQRQRLPHPRPRLLRGRRARGRPRLSRGVVEGLPQERAPPLPPELAHRALAHGARPRRTTPGRSTAPTCAPAPPPARRSIR